MEDKIMEKCYELYDGSDGVTLEKTASGLLLHYGKEKIKHFATPEDLLEDEMNGAAILYYDQIAFQGAKPNNPWGRAVMELSKLIHRLPYGVSAVMEDGQTRYRAVVGENEAETFLGIFDAILDAAFEVCKEEDRRSMEKFLERSVDAYWYDKY